MNDGLEQVRIIIGDDETSGISDNAIKDVLWENYFDIEQTTEWALGAWFDIIEHPTLVNSNTRQRKSTDGG